jgi:hypothetical protein
MAQICDGCRAPPWIDPSSGAEIPLKKCSRCKTVAYHDKICQKGGFPAHKQQCLKFAQAKAATASSPPQTPSTPTHGQLQHLTPVPLPTVYKIEERPHRGKCLVAKRALRFGDVVSMSHYEGEFFAPLVPPVLFETCRDSVCAICFGKIEVGKEYPVSDFEKYRVITCSPLCHEASDDWLKAEIETIRTMCAQTGGGPPKFLSTAILVYRIIIKMESRGKSLSWKDIEEMQTHDTKPSEDESHHLRAIVMTVQALLSAKPPPSKASISVDKIAQILARIKFNGFSICDAESNSLGIGLFGTANRINHSCKPNAVQSFFYGEQDIIPKLRVTVCSTSIPSGSEICISYIDNKQPRKMRQESLKRDYNFDCTCPYCKDDKHDGYIMGLRCSSSRCKHTCRGSEENPKRLYWCRSSNKWKCTTCEQEADQNPEPILQAMEDCLQTNSNDAMRRMYEGAREHFDPSSWYVHELADRLARFHIDSLHSCPSETERKMHLASASKLLSDIRDNLPPYGENRDWQTLGHACLIYKQHKLLLLQGLRHDVDDLCFALMMMEDFFSLQHPVLQEQVFKSIQ